MHIDVHDDDADCLSQSTLLLILMFDSHNSASNLCVCGSCLNRRSLAEYLLGLELLSDCLDMLLVLRMNVQLLLSEAKKQMSHLKSAPTAQNTTQTDCAQV